MKGNNRNTPQSPGLSPVELGRAARLLSFDEFKKSSTVTTSPAEVLRSRTHSAEPPTVTDKCAPQPSTFELPFASQN